MNRPVVERRSVVRRSRDAEPARFAVGLDLGQSQDYSALVVVEQLWELKARGWEPGEPCSRLQAPEYQVRHVERFPLGTTYPDIVDEVENVLCERALVNRSRLVVDATGVGAPVADMFLRKGAPLQAVSITSGDAISYKGRTVRVPKRDLVSVLQVLFQSRRLKIAQDVSARETLLSELRTFSAKITTKANETYEAWREGQHDDLVLALALACWSFERTGFGRAVSLNITGLGRSSG